MFVWTGGVSSVHGSNILYMLVILRLINWRSGGMNFILPPHSCLSQVVMAHLHIFMIEFWLFSHHGMICLLFCGIQMQFLVLLTVAKLVQRWSNFNQQLQADNYSTVWSGCHMGFSALSTNKTMPRGTLITWSSSWHPHSWLLVMAHLFMVEFWRSMAWSIYCFVGSRHSCWC